MTHQQVLRVILVCGGALLVFSAHADEVKTTSVQTILDQGRALQASGKPEEAIQHFHKALTILKQRHGENAHLDLALCHFYLGSAWTDQRAYEKALSEFDLSLAQYQRQVSKCSPNVIPVLHYQGTIHLHLKNRVKAREAFREALRTERQYLTQLISTTPETQAMALEARAWAFARLGQPGLQGYLSATRGVPGTVEQAYRQVWEAKNLYTHFLEEQLSSTQKARRTIVEMFKKAVPRNNPGLRILAFLNRNRARETVRPTPEGTGDKPSKAEKSPSEELSRVLKPGTVFLDFVRYIDFSERDKLQDRYAVFVLTSKGPIKRVDLHNGEEIDKAITAWRDTVLDQNAWQPKAPVAVRQAWENEIERKGREVRRLVWEPIQHLIPTNASRIYIAPDGGLTRFPFAALPGARSGTVLLEEPFTIGYVPDGQFLFEELHDPALPAKAPGSLLAMGNVRLKPYRGDLPGIARFMERFEILGRGRYSEVYTGERATAETIKREIPRFRIVHLATHAIVEDSKLIDQQQKLKDQLRRWQFQPYYLRKADPLSASPLSYVKILCAGAEDPTIEDADVRHKETDNRYCLTGDDIAALELFELRLMVLHACRTGEGQYLVGEGLQSVHRAVHLGKCPNAMASLWNAKDLGTAALMEEFYDQLWTHHKTPIDALKAAQLKIYYNPELAEGGSDLGPPQIVRKDPDIRNLPPLPHHDRTQRRGATRIWAAFVLSGVGEWKDFPVSVEDAPASNPVPSTPPQSLSSSRALQLLPILILILLVIVIIWIRHFKVVRQ